MIGNTSADMVGGFGSTGFDVGAAVASGINAGASIYNTYQTNEANADIAQQNIEFQKLENALNREYQDKVNAMNERLMRESWARDDAARQRMVKDLETAGLSKWLATGASPMSSSPVSMNAIKTDAPHNDMKYKTMGLDALGHIYGNYLQYAQTERQNNILDKQGEVLTNNVEESAARAEIARHDADVFKNRPDVASTDPATLKYIAEAINTLKGRNETGSMFRNSVGSLVDKIKEEREARALARSEKKQQKEIKKDEKYVKSYGYERRKPMSITDWATSTQTPLGTQEAAKLYHQYVEAFNKYANQRR